MMQMLSTMEVRVGMEQMLITVWTRQIARHQLVVSWAFSAQKAAAARGPHHQQRSSLELLLERSKAILALS